MLSLSLMTTPARAAGNAATTCREGLTDRADL
jgi:hypothetical protein